ncbi:YrzI family small protein [Heyndrickxia coagulans]|nr:YrzI family small protein [Heyndrickxia coagulans]
MTLNLIFITVTIKRLKKTVEQRQRDEEVFRLYDEMNTKREAFQARHF